MKIMYLPFKVVLLKRVRRKTNWNVVLPSEAVQVVIRSWIRLYRRNQLNGKKTKRNRRKTRRTRTKTKIVKISNMIHFSRQS